MTHDEFDEILRDYLLYLEHVRLPATVPTTREEAKTMCEELTRRSDENPHRDAWEPIDDLIHEDPENAWRILLATIERSHDRDLGMIGAGTLETFMWYRGVEFLDRVLAEIRSNGRFRQAFESVYLGSDFPETEGRLINATLIASGTSPESTFDWWTNQTDA